MTSLFQAGLVLAVLIATAAGPAVASQFVDILDAPATPSLLASKSQLVTVTHAGSRLVAAGMRGHIVYSDDGGNSWTQASVPVSVTLTDLSFPTETRGWAVGHSGVVLFSNDGGQTWQLQTDGRRTEDEMIGYYRQSAAGGDERASELVEELPLNWMEGPEQPWLGVLFEDEQHGYVVGAFNLMMETRDGGNNWTPWSHRIDNLGGYHLNAVERIGPALYLPSEAGVVFRKRNDEQMFVPLQTDYTGSFFGVCGNEQLLLAYGLRGTVYASYDKGDSWHSLPSITPVAITSCTADNDGGFLLAAASGQMMSVKLESGSANIALSDSAPWPLAGISMGPEGVVVGAGMLGVWRQEK